MRRASILATAALAVTGAMTLAGPASAQSPSQSAGLRHLSWPGRGETAAPAEATPVRRDLRRPNTVIPHGGFATTPPAPPRPGLTPAPGGRRGSLTPANAWMRPAAPPPEATPVPIEAAPPPPPPPPAPAPLPAYVADRGGQPAPAEVVHAPAPEPPAPAEVAPADPMAPRRDAPIFRLQQRPPPTAAPAPDSAAPEAEDAGQAEPARPRHVAEVVNTGERPPRQGARYYSVHRQNGRQPDALDMPAPTYVDALAVTMAETPASQDLAQPDQGPTLIRDNQGRLRAAPAASDGDHQ